MGALFSSNVIQYGFAGFAVIQLIAMYSMFVMLVKALRANTASSVRLIAMLDARPCLHNDRALKEYHERD